MCQALQENAGIGWCHNKAVISRISLWLITLLMLLATVAVSSAADTSLFGPRKYVRQQGKPATRTSTFTACTAATGATLRLTNGSGKCSRVSSAVVTLNGVTVVSERDFSKNVPSLVRTVTLKPGVNTIAVTIKSGQGNKGDDSSEEDDNHHDDDDSDPAAVSLVIEITGKACGNSDTTPPVISVPVPADGALLNTARPVISAGYADITGGSGIDSASVRVTLDGSDISSSCSVSANGTACTLVNDLTDGSHAVTVSVSDVAKNPASLTWRFITDTKTPLIAITTPASGLYLNATSATVSGSIDDPAAAVTVNGTVATISGATFSSAAIPLGEGVNSITAVALDKAGNRSETTISVTVDTSLPVVTIVAPVNSSFTNIPNIAVSGSVNEPPASVMVNGRTATVTGSDFTMAGFPLAEGNNSIIVEARDKAGNKGSGNVTLILDTVAPQIFITAPANDLLTRNPQLTVTGTLSEPVNAVTLNGQPITVSGTSFAASLTLTEGVNSITLEATDRAGNKGTTSRTVTLDSTPPGAPVLEALTTPTSNPAVTLRGSSEPGSVVTLLSGSTKAGTVTVDASGLFSFFGLTLSEGENNFSASSVDAAGNQSAASAALTVTLDTKPPQVAITTPVDKANLNTPVITVSGTIDDPAAIITVNGLFARNDGIAWTLENFTLQEGSNSLLVEARDPAGNKGTATATLALDTIPPTVMVSTPIDGLYTNVAQLTVSGTVNETVASVTVASTSLSTGKLRTASVNGLNFTLTDLQLSEGNNSITIEATDLAGNKGRATLSVTLDTVAPQLSVIGPADGALLNNGQITFGGSATEPVVSVLINGIIAQPAADGGYTLPVTLAEGSNTLTVTATDRAGNRTTSSITVTLDSIPPTAPLFDPLATPTRTSIITVSGQSEPDSTVKLFNNGQLIGTLKADAAGLFTQQNLTLNKGDNALSANATDAAGNLGPLSAPMTVVLDTKAPVITVTAPLNGLLTNNTQVQITGSVDDGSATVTVGGAAVTLVNRSAPLTGATFSGGYLLSDGDNNIETKATDAAGNVGVASVHIILDAQPPQLALSAPATATAGTDVTITLSASDNRGLTLVDLTADGASLWSASPNGGASVNQNISLRLSPTLNTGSTVTVRARALDAAGNSGSATAVITIDKVADTPGYIQGKVLDDGRGLLLSGAKVSVIDVKGGAQNLTTGDDGSWFFELPSGTARLEIVKEGFSTVYRDVTVRPGQRTSVLDSRLTRIDGTVRLLDATGGVVVGAGLASARSLNLSIPANALSTQTDLRLTPVSNQGLTATLPVGWSPLAAFDLRLLGPTTSLPIEPQPLSAAATVTMPLPKGLGTTSQIALFARYDATRRVWLANSEITIAAGATSVTTAISQPGQYALVLPDPAPAAPPQPTAGQELTAATLQSSDFSQITAAGRVVPQASPPSVGLKAAGDLSLSAAADATTAQTLSSGLVVNAHVTEKFNLTSGDSLQPPATVQNIVLYRYPCVTNIAGGVTNVPALSGAEVRTTFPVAPSKDFTIVDLLLGKISIAITPPEQSGGIMVGTDGARLLQPDGTSLVIPAGALDRTVPVTVATLPDAGIASLVGADFKLLRGVDLTITGQTLKLGATLSIPAPTGFDPALPVVVAKKYDVKGGSKLKLVALAKQSGTIISSEPLPPELANFTTSINSSGQYLLLQATAPIGYVGGTVTDSTNAPFGGIQITVPSATLSDVTGNNGAYLLATATGEQIVTALDPARGDAASATAAIQTNLKTTLNLTVRMTPPQVTSVSPANGAGNVQPDVSVTVTFSKPMDKTGITSATLVVRDAANATVPGVLTFNVDTTAVTFYPTDAFKQETGYNITISAAVKDLQGYPLGQDVTSTFTIRKTTPPVMPAAGAISGTVPDADGYITVTGTHGSAPADCTVLLINNTSGEIASIKPASNGSFTGRVRGQLGDEIKTVLMDYSGNQTVISYLTFKSPDGSYLVTAKGGKVEGEGGSVLDIPEGALVGPTVIKITTLPEANLPSPLQTPGRYLGAVNIDTGGIAFQKAVEISIPLPDGFNTNTPVFLTKPGTLINSDDTTEQVYEIIDSTKIVGNRITSACEPFPGVWAGGSLVFTSFAEIQPIIVSGFAYQDRNDLPSYQAPPDGVIETPLKDPITGKLTYKYDRPIRSAVIRSPDAWNYVSYTNSKGFYGSFGFMIDIPTAFAGDTVCKTYRLTAINPQTMYRHTFDGSACVQPYNVQDVNFQLASKDTIPPDRTAPIITLTLSPLKLSPDFTNRTAFTKL